MNENPAPRIAALMEVSGSRQVSHAGKIAFQLAPRLTRAAGWATRSAH